MSRFFMIKYKWFKRDKKRYDQRDESSLNLDTHKRTSIILVSFVKLTWDQNLFSQNCRFSEFSFRLLTHRLSSLVICDVFSIECIRQSHARFVLLYNELFSILSKHTTGIRLKHDILNQYHASENELLDVIMSELNDNLRTSIDTMIQTCDYCRYLEDAMNQELVDWAITIEDEM